ncbi:MAG: hypothetical protein JRI91_15590 [Deltaproteobacteria bacterium]|nr:hypothetical protein [Deltaproteobacteria bacterium]
MSKYYMIGGMLCVGGVIMVIFQAVSSMMTAGDIVWKSLSLVDVISTEYLAWIDGISWQSIQKNIKYITTIPLYLLMLSVGCLSMVVGGVVDK